MNNQNSTSDKRMQILDGAEKIFAVKGYAAARVEEIADEAGVAKGTIYLYFPSKEEVFVSLIEERVNELINLVTSSIQHLDCAVTSLHSQLVTQIEFYTEHVGLLDVAFQYAPHLSYKLQQRLNGSRMKLVQLTVGVVRRIAQEPIDVSITSMAAIIDGAMSNLLLNYFLTDNPIEPGKIADDLVAILLPGLLKQKG